MFDKCICMLTRQKHLMAHVCYEIVVLNAALFQRKCCTDLVSIVFTFVLFVFHFYTVKTCQFRGTLSCNMWFIHLRFKRCK